MSVIDNKLINYGNLAEFQSQILNDSSVSGLATWSSSKIASELEDKQDVLTAGTGIDISNGVISATGGGGSVDLMQSITYAELKALRDNKQLVPGQQYRITDYVTTTAQANTQSAGHQFDIIVVADSEDKLNENARAINHPNMISAMRVNDENEGDYYIYVRYPEGDDENGYAWAYNPNGNNIPFSDMPVGGWVNIASEDLIYTDTLTPSISDVLDMSGTEVTVTDFSDSINADYFANSKLESWELKYCLDNDTDRFAWANAGGNYLVCGDFIDCTGEYDESESHYYIDAGDYKYYYEGTIEDNGTTYYIWSHDYTGETGIIKVLTTQNTYTNTSSGTNNNGCDYYDNVYNVVGEITIDGEEFSDLYKSDKKIIKTENSPGGKGVIYYMKDEFNNECPYDFKNIQFIYEDENTHDIYYCYTFTYHYNISSNLIADATIVGNDGSLFDSNGYVAGCYRNVIKEYRKERDELPKLLTLNDIVFYDSETVQSGEYSGCYDNYFDYDCYSNRLSNVKGNKFGIICSRNTLENCSNNTFGIGCELNTFKLCQNNVFGNYSQSHRISYYFIRNVVGNGCVSIKNHNVTITKVKFGDFCVDLDFSVNYSSYNRLQNLYILNNSSFPNGVPYGINDYNDYLKLVGRNSQGTFTVKNPLD